MQIDLEHLLSERWEKTYQWFRRIYMPDEEGRWYPGPTRSEQFALMERLGFPVVPHGYVDEHLPYERVVVYTDELGHVGQEKELVSRNEAIRNHSGLLYSKYIECQPPTSLRLLRIGYRNFFIKMVSDNDPWRSNCGTGHMDIRVGPICRLPFDDQLHPIWAVDFVPDREGNIWAVDFNERPGVREEVAVHLFRGNVVDELNLWFILREYPEAVGG